MRIGSRYIDDRLYKKILEVLPVACVDAVIVSRKGKRRFLLGKRRNKPAKGQWFLIGGRILKGEKLEDAVRRHINAETGITKIKIIRQLCARETIFKTSAQGSSSHTVNTVYLVRVASIKINPANRENSKLRWFKRIDRAWHPYVKEMLRKAGFR